MKQKHYHRSESLGEKVPRYFDDTGTIYRVGNNLLADTTYILGGAKYHTDHVGRIIHVSFDNLQLIPSGQTRKSLSSISINDIGKGWECPGDHKGHLIGDRFYGSNDIGNLVPMSPKLNLSSYKVIENIWANAIHAQKKVRGSIDIIYLDVSFRPMMLNVRFWVDSTESFEIISN